MTENEPANETEAPEITDMTEDETVSESEYETANEPEDEAGDTEDEPEDDSVKVSKQMRHTLAGLLIGISEKADISTVSVL